MPVYNLQQRIEALYLDEAQGDDIRATLDAIHDEYHGEQYGAQDMIRSYLYILLVKASRMSAPGAPADTSRRSHLLARSFKALLEEHVVAVQDPAEYARMLHVTERALNEAVRRALGQTSAQLVRDRLMLEAKRLLAHSSESITSVATQLAFEDPAYFSRCFKKHTGRTPLEFRQSLARVTA
jgi:AraC-like DNA-binding protein